MEQERQRGNVPGTVARAVGENVHSRRNDLGISARELAERLTERGRRFSMSGVQKVERAERRVDVDDLLAFADALDTDAATLLGLSGPTRRTTLGQRLDVGRRHGDLRRALDRAVWAGVPADVVLDYVDDQVRQAPAVRRAFESQGEVLSRISRAETVAEAVELFEDPAVSGEPGEASGTPGLIESLRRAPESFFSGRDEFAAEVADELERRGR